MESLAMEQGRGGSGTVGFLTLGLNHIGLTSDTAAVAALILDECLGLWLNLRDIDSAWDRGRGNGGGARRTSASCAKDRASCCGRSAWSSALLGDHSGALLHRLDGSLLQLIDLLPQVAYRICFPC